MHLVRRLVVAVACAGLVSCAAAGFWVSQLVVGTAGGATALPTFSSPVTIDPITMTFPSPVTTIVMTIPGFPPEPAATTTTAASPATTAAPAPTAAAPMPAAVGAPAASVEAAAAPGSTPTSAAPAAATTPTKPAAPPAPTTEKERTSPHVSHDGEQEAAAAATTAADSSPAVETAAPAAAAPPPNATPKPDRSAGIAPKAVRPAVAAKPRPDPSSSAPPAHIAAPPRVARDGHSPGVVGAAFTGVGDSDKSIPRPLAVAALAGGAGLLAAGLGLFVVGVVKRRAIAVAARETCETAIWRADGDGDFYAQAVGPGGEGYVAARSVMFRWNGNDTPPDTGPVLAAYNVLVQRLMWDGWTLEENETGAWWEASFSRQAKAAGAVAGE